MSDFLGMLFGLFIAIAVKSVTPGHIRWFSNALRQALASDNLTVLLGSNVLEV